MVYLAGRYARVPAGALLVVLLVHAPLSELVQGALLADRSADPWDILADVTGTVLAVAIWRDFRGRGTGIKHGRAGVG